MFSLVSSAKLLNSFIRCYPLTRVSKLFVIILTISIFFIFSTLFLKFYKIKTNVKTNETNSKHPSLSHTNDGFPYVPYEMGNNHLIPRIIHQTFKSKTRNEMTRGMQNATLSFKSNSKFQYIYYNDDEVLQFLLDNYGVDSDEVYAFNNLIPKAYKIDFWRLAILYIKGGYYADVDSVLLKELDKWIENNATLVLPVGYASSVWFGFDFAFIASVPQHPLLRIAMDMIIYNVKNKYIPEVPRKLAEHDNFLQVLAISGPVVIGKAYNRLMNEPDEVPHNIVKGRSRGVQFLGFCSNNGIMSFSTIPHQRNYKECRGDIVIRSTYEEYRHERRTNHTIYWKDYIAGSIYR